MDSASYGTSRGSGVLLKTRKDWKIAPYNLSFPLPNDLAKKMTDEIKVFEAKEKAPTHPVKASPAADPAVKR